MKLCPTCKTLKSPDDYGRSYYCKSCMAERGRIYRAKNPLSLENKAKAKEWREKNRDRRAKWNRDWLIKNKEWRSEYRAESYRKNKEQENSLSAAYKAAHKEELACKRAIRLKANPEINRFARSLRRAAEKRAMPSWADKGKMKAIYLEAVRLTRETGIEHHVDHIYPLQSEIVCGLHCEANLQVITASANHSKRNRVFVQ